MSWISEVVDAYAENEAPPKFFYWSALAALSAVMRKRVSLDRYHYRLYPNIYVFLVARSGMKKGVPVNMAKSLITKANCTRIISGRNSMQRIVSDLGKTYTLDNGTMITEAQGVLISGELAAFLVKDPDALTVLTDLHDTHAYEEEWKNSLKGTGVDKLKAPCLALLGATNEEHFAEAVPQTAIGGGFIARTFVVFSQQRGTLNSLTQAPKTIPNTDELAKYLKSLALLKGNFQWSDAARLCYDQWYYKFMAEIHADPTGTLNRIGDQIIKVAMLLSLAEGRDLMLRESNIIEAIKVSLDCEVGMRQVTMGIGGKSNLAEQTKLFIRTLMIAKDHKLTRAGILQEFWGNMDHFDLDRIVETMVGADWLDVLYDGKKATYVLKKSALDFYAMEIKGIQ